MKRYWKAKWIKALTSGGYKKGIGTLVKSGRSTTYCCLGVLARIQGAEFVAGYPIIKGKCRNESLTTLDLAYNCGLKSDEMCTLIQMNDNENKSFRKIAEYIKENIKGT